MGRWRSTSCGRCGSSSRAIASGRRRFRATSRRRTVCCSVRRSQSNDEISLCVLDSRSDFCRPGAVTAGAGSRRRHAGASAWLPRAGRRRQPRGGPEGPAATAERLRGVAVAPNGDLYAKTTVRRHLRAARHQWRRPGRVDQGVRPRRWRHAYRVSRWLAVSLEPDGGLSLQIHARRARTRRARWKPSSRSLPAEKDHDAKAFAFDDQGRHARRDRIALQRLQQPRSSARRERAWTPTEFQKTYGGFWRFDANRLNQTQADGMRFSTGHRHALALALASGVEEFLHGADGARQPQRRRIQRTMTRWTTPSAYRRSCT